MSVLRIQGIYRLNMSMKQVPEEFLKPLDDLIALFHAQILKMEEDLKISFESLTSAQKVSRIESEAIYFWQKNFLSDFRFLRMRIEREEKSEIHNFIPYSRMLFELYAELFYFLLQETRLRVGIYIAKQLLYYSDHYNNLGPDGLDPLKIEYLRLLTTWKDVIAECKIESLNVPIEEFNKKKIGKSSIDIPPYDQIFQERNRRLAFRSLSCESLSGWSKESPDRFYPKYYRSQSYYTHKSCVNQMEHSLGTERFWLIQFSYIIGLMMSELVDKRIFENSFSEQRKDISESIAGIYPRFSEAWKSAVIK